MRVRCINPRRVAGAVSIALLAVAVGCGTRGAPLPPVYPNPVAIGGLTVAQRGAFAILRFPPPAIFSRVGAEDVELETVEVLVYAERYPVVTTDMLVAGIHRKAEVMRSDAAIEAAAARAAETQRLAEEEAAAAGLDAPLPDPDGPATTVRQRGRDEDRIHRLPEEIRLDWQRSGLAADAILQSAQRLVDDTEAVWRLLNLPATVLDPGQPLPLPADSAIAAASDGIVAAADYERALPLQAFLGRASVSRTLPVEQFADLLVDEVLQVAVPVGTAASGPLRTRYFFAVRARSTRNTPGLVAAQVPLAPAAVPVAPANVAATVVASGVELTWDAPIGDIALRRFDADGVGYNVYRMEPDGVAGAEPLNAVPLNGTTYTDITMSWGQEYVYEVRALRSGAAATPVRESEGARTNAFEVIDTSPPAPPSNVVPQRAGARVALQWTPSPTIDIVGYRVYRHPFPAPDVPLRFDPSAAEFDLASRAPRAAQNEGEDNPMVAAGWELVTPNPVPFSRASDPAADPEIRYVYAVEAMDAAGNLSALAVAIEPGDRNR